MRPDDLDRGGYQPSTQTAAPDLSASAAQAVNAVASGSQNSYEVIIENIDLNLYKDYGFVFSYILSNDNPQDKTIVVGPPSPRFVVTQSQVAAAIPDYTEAPTNVVATGGVLSYQVTWDKPTWTNYTDTIIWEGTSNSFNGSEPVVWTGTGTQANILASSTADRYIKILHRDKFFHSNTTSANKFVIRGPIKPVDPIVVDITGPPAVGSASVSGGIDPDAYLGFNGYANINWGAVTSGDIRGYRIRFKPVGGSVYSYADSPGSGTSYKLEGLGVGVTYEFAVATYDQYNNTTSGYVSGGTLEIPGTPVMNGYISAGAFKFGDGVVSGKRGLLFNSSNYWYINSGSTAEFQVGGSTSNYIKWDGSTLNIDGNIGATGTATIGGNINLSTSGASIYNGTINTAGTLTGNGFALNSTGLKVANGSNSVTLDAATGTITANAGSIGNWSLSETQISKNNAVLDSSGYIQLGNSNVGTIIKMSSSETASSDGNTYRMWIGSNDPTTAPFRITSAGKLYGTGVVITGDSSFSGTLSIGTALSDGGTIGDVKLTASQAAAIANSASSTASSASATASSASATAQQAATDARTAKEANAATDAIARAALPSTSFDGDAIAAKINSPTTTTTIDGGRLTAGTIRSNAVVSDFISAFSINADKITTGTISGVTGNFTTGYVGGFDMSNGDLSARFSVGPRIYFGNKINIGWESGYPFTSSNVFNFTAGSNTGSDGAQFYVNTNSNVFRFAADSSSRAYAAEVRNTLRATNLRYITSLINDSSSRRFKENITYLPENYYSRILNVKPAFYTYINEHPETDSALWGTSAMGPIAEELEEAGLGFFVERNLNGQPTALRNEHKLTYLLIPLVKDMKEKIDLLESRILELETTNV